MYKLLATAFVLVVSVSAFTYAATYGGGSGTKEDPYQIWTPEQMNTIGLNPGDWGKHFKLMADIDMSAYTGTEYNIIGNKTTYFSGTFDGNSHVIINLTIERPTENYIGLFGYLYGGQIMNLGVENTDIAGGGYVGGLVGRNEDGGTITDCYATGTVSGSGSCVGGLCGYSAGTISTCYATGAVSGTGYYVGGLIGYKYRGTITDCYATGSVSGTDSVGGLVGLNINSSITSCYATGTVSGPDAIGVGGLVGYNGGSTITSCYATGAVSGTGYYVGGLCGYNSGKISNSFWDIQTSGQTDGVSNQIPDTSGVIGLDTATMQTQSTFADVGWDFTDSDGDPADWMMLREGEDYPRLAWQPLYSGDMAGLYGVDLVDYAELARNWMNQNCPINCEQADIDNSGTVDLADLSILTADWLR